MSDGPTLGLRLGLRPARSRDFPVSDALDRQGIAKAWAPPAGQVHRHLRLGDCGSPCHLYLRKPGFPEPTHEYVAHDTGLAFAKLLVNREVASTSNQREDCSVTMPKDMRLDVRETLRR